MSPSDLSSLRSETDGIRAALTDLAESLADVGAPAGSIRGIEKLLVSLEQPCTIAVVGRVKAGKSTFVNALLGEDLAKVGATETTATINRFIYGVPDPLRPVRVYWTGGRTTDEGREFLDGLQGNDEATLRRAVGIECLEYRLPSPFLERVNLVDTPGLAAVVDEHQDRAAAFLGVQAQLRDRNIAATERLSNEADAVIYLIGQVARSTDQAFLEEFSHTTSGKAHVQNALGVLSKVDIQPEVMARRHALCVKIADQLKDSLNTVLPVSAALQRRLDQLREDDNAGFRAFSREIAAIPEDVRELLLQSDELFTELELDGCPSPAKRLRLLGDTPWSTFTTLATHAFPAGDDPGPEAERAALAKLEELAGFAPLRELLRRRFMERGELLRGYRIVGEARAYLSDLRYRTLPEWKQQDRPVAERFKRWAGFVASIDEEDEDRDELLAYLREELQKSSGRSGKLEQALRAADRRLAALKDDLQEVYEDFEALEMIDTQPEVITGAAEVEELRALFGLYGRDFATRLRVNDASGDPGPLRAQAETCARTWKSKGHAARLLSRQTLCNRAANRYETLLGALWDDEV